MTLWKNAETPTAGACVPGIICNSQVGVVAQSRQVNCWLNNSVMNRIASITVSISLNEGVSATAEKAIAISLDCSDCLANKRTVVFEEGVNHGVCHSSQHWFRGVWLRSDEQIANGRFEVTYEVLYQYEPFIDVKPGPSAGPSEGAPTWARVYFNLLCPRCKASQRASTQSNLVRPCVHTCECGFELYTDDAPPALSWRKGENA